MQILNKIKKETIIICDNNYKNKLLLYLNETKRLYNIKFMTFNELIKSFYFDYDEKTIYYLMNKYNLKYDVAKIYIDNMYYIDNKNYDFNKLKMLVSYKKELDENNLLIKDFFFTKLIKDKDILICNYVLTKFQKKVINELKQYANVELFDDELKNYEHTSFEFNTIDEEVNFVAHSICDLISSGVDINNIKISNINNDYNNSIKRIFGFYNIPINLKNCNSIFSTIIAKDFLSNYSSDIKRTFSIISKYADTDIYNKIVNICNKYVWCDNYLLVKDLIIHDLKNTYINSIKYENAIEIINYKDKTIDNEYVYLMNFNLGSIPTIYKDEEFITDSIKSDLPIDTTIDKNIMEKIDVIKSINNIKNLIITYKLKSPSSVFYPSNLIEYYNSIHMNLNYKKSYSELNDQITLASLYDELVKYGTKSDTLYLLNHNYNIPYLKYSNKYSKIDNKKLEQKLSNKFVLSYTTLNEYNECSFKYYLDKILNLNIYEENFSATLGTIFHHILEVGLQENIDVDIEINKFIKEKYSNKVLTNKELFFIKKIEPEIQFVIDTIKKQMTHCSLDKEEHEKSINVYFDKNIKVVFNGKIDKILYMENNNQTIVAIIDYKTGNPEIDLSLMNYGLHLQLPIYIYLSKNMNFKNVEIAGIYLQKVMPSLEKIDCTKTIEQIKNNNLKLIGYSNSNKEILEKLDNSFESSSVIKSMKTNKDGSFSFYSKVLSSSNFNKITELVDGQINKCIDNILDANFNINPKKIYGNSDILGCNYCKFKDICFRNNKDIEYIEPDKELEYLGDDIDA